MEKLTKEQQQLFGGLAVLIIGGGFVFWNYLLGPSLKSINEKKNQLSDLEAKVARAEQQANRLPALQSELEKLKTELSSLESQLPRAKDMPGILRILSKNAQQENVNFSSLRPLDPKKDQYFDILEFDVQVVSPLHSFIRFVSALAQEDRIFQVEQVKFSPNSSTGDLNLGSPQLNISFSLKTYAYSL